MTRSTFRGNYSGNNNSSKKTSKTTYDNKMRKNFIIRFFSNFYLTIMLFFFSALVIAFFIIINIFFKLKEININSDLLYTNENIINKLNLKKGVYTFLIEKDFLEQVIKNSFAAVGEVKVDVNSSSVDIFIRQKKIIAKTKFNNGSTQKEYYISKDGVLFNADEVNLGINQYYLDIEGFVLYGDQNDRYEIKPYLKGILDTLYDLRINNTDFYNKISKIHVEKYVDYSYSIILYIKEKDTAFYIEDEFNIKNIEKLFKIEDYLSNKKGISVVKIFEDSFSYN